MNSKGFTMVEVMAVMIILSSVILIAVPAYNNVSNNIKTSNLKNKEDTISIAMLKFANTYLLDDIKPLNNNCTNEHDCCKEYDLYNYIIKYGIYTSETVEETDGTVSSFVTNPITGQKLTGCVQLKYNIKDYKITSEFINNCSITDASGFKSCS